MVYEIDCSLWTDRQHLHESLMDILPLPDYYGRNLDALFDALMDLPKGTEIRLMNTHAAEELGDYGEVALQVFQDAAEYREFVLEAEE